MASKAYENVQQGFAYELQYVLKKRGELINLDNENTNSKAVLPISNDQKGKCTNNNKHLMAGLEGNSKFCFPRVSRETKFTVPQGTSH